MLPASLFGTQRKPARNYLFAALFSLAVHAGLALITVSSGPAFDRTLSNDLGVEIDLVALGGFADGPVAGPASDAAPQETPAEIIEEEVQPETPPESEPEIVEKIEPETLRPVKPPVREQPRRITTSQAVTNAERQAAPARGGAVGSGAAGAGGGQGASSPEALGPLSNPRPQYPRLARERGQQGEVRLRVHVSSDGTVEQVSVEQGSGHRLLDEAAVKAVSRWRFRPAHLNGRPINGVALVTVEFRME